MRIFQINTSVNTGSTGRIAEEIGQTVIANGMESYIAYGRIVRDCGINMAFLLPTQLKGLLMN